MKHILATLLATATLAACGGGSSSESAPRASNDAILTAAGVTNIDSTGFPFSSETPRYENAVKRWTLPIPVKTNGEARAVAAMDAIEAKLGMTLFDRTSIAGTPDASITRGIIVSVGTSYWPAGAPAANFCANVSGYNDGMNPGFPPGFLAAPGEISARIYVNLDNAQCIASAEITVHEFGHALGMGEHFYGFGNGPAISADFWDVLATLYHYPSGTPKASVTAIRLP